MGGFSFTREEVDRRERREGGPGRLGLGQGLQGKVLDLKLPVSHIYIKTRKLA